MNKPDTVHLCGQDIQRPGHICAFFDSREEEYDILIPYLREGVNKGEKILKLRKQIRDDVGMQRLQ